LGALTAKLAKMRALIEYGWRTVLDTSPMVFATLIDDKPDPQGHMSRLNITRAERSALVHQIDSGFKKKFADPHNIDDVASIALVLRDYLTKKGFHCSDE
jgi:hypothetical protein